MIRLFPDPVVVASAGPIPSATLHEIRLSRQRCRNTSTIGRRRRSVKPLLITQRLCLSLLGDLLLPAWGLKTKSSNRRGREEMPLRAQRNSDSAVAQDHIMAYGSTLTFDVMGDCVRPIVYEFRTGVLFFAGSFGERGICFHVLGTRHRCRVVFLLTS